MRRLAVQIRAVLARSSFASAVAAIIEDENARAGFEQRRDVLEPMTDVPGVAVTNQVNEVFTRRVLVRGKKPAIQPQSVRGLKMNVLERAAQLATVRFHLARRLINLTMFEPAQHKINNRQQNEQSNDFCGSSRRPAVGHGKKCHTDN